VYLVVKQYVLVLVVDKVLVQLPLRESALVGVVEFEHFGLLEDGDPREELAELVFVDEHALVDHGLHPLGVGHAGLQLDFHHSLREFSAREFPGVVLEGFRHGEEFLGGGSDFQVEIYCDSHIIGCRLLESNSTLSCQYFRFQVVLIYFGKHFLCQFSFFGILYFFLVPRVGPLEVQNVLHVAYHPFFNTGIQILTFMVCLHFNEVDIL